MARIIKPLTEVKIKNAKPKDKAYTLRDGGGLVLKVNVNGSKIWYIDFKNPITGKRNTKKLANYQDANLKQARELAQEFKGNVREDKKTGVSFGYVYKEYFDKMNNEKSYNYIKSEQARLRHLEILEDAPINDLTKDDFISISKALQSSGKVEQGHRVFNLAKRILDYAVANDYMESNFLQGLPKHLILQKAKTKNYPHIKDEKEFARLLVDIDEYFGTLSTKLALQLIAHTFVRPANIRFMEWEEIDFENFVWKIPAEKMKMDKEHIVPLSKQAMAIINDAYEARRSTKYVFPSPTSSLKPISENTLSQALMRLGYKDIMTAHGFRHSASTLLHENMHIHGVTTEIIELQLAHTDRNSIRAVYNKADYKSQREKLMQWWSDYLDEIKHKASIDRYRR